MERAAGQRPKEPALAFGQGVQRGGSRQQGSGESPVVQVDTQKGGAAGGPSQSKAFGHMEQTEKRAQAEKGGAAGGRPRGEVGDYIRLAEEQTARPELTDEYLKSCLQSYEEVNRRISRELQVLRGGLGCTAAGQGAVDCGRWSTAHQGDNSQRA